MRCHFCPVCARPHYISETCHRFAYGRQLTCSAHCKLVWRHRVLGVASDVAARAATLLTIPVLEKAA